MGIRRGSISTPIIVDGLVFNMDAANRASYPRTGTTVTDTINNLSVILTNGPGFQTLGNGSINFDGVNDIGFSTNGSEKIQGSSTIQGQITTNNATATLVYQDATKGWTSQDVILVPQTINTEYFLIGGGATGGGGSSGGGGGAGGLYTGTHTFDVGNTINITIGAGGTTSQQKTKGILQNITGSDGLPEMASFTQVHNLRKELNDIIMNDTVSDFVVKKDIIAGIKKQLDALLGEEQLENALRAANVGNEASGVLLNAAARLGPADDRARKCQPCQP